MKLISPVNTWKVTSPFGPRWGTMHNGVDLPVVSGTIARSPLSGVVLTASFNNDKCGGTIITEHKNPFGDGKIRLAYCHMRKINVRQGERISKGENLGETGGASQEYGAGNSLGSHLHFGLKVNGVWKNPDNYFEQGVLKSNTLGRTIVLLIYVGGLSYVVYSLLKKR